MAISLPLQSTLRSDSGRQAVADTIAGLTAGWPVERFLLWGSKARGDDDRDIDIDLLAITTGEVTPAAEAAMNDVAWQAGIGRGKVVQLVIRSHDRWWHGIDQATPLRRQIDRDGIEVSCSQDRKTAPRLRGAPTRPLSIPPEERLRGCRDRHAGGRGGCDQRRRGYRARFSAAAAVMMTGRLVGPRGRRQPAITALTDGRSRGARPRSGSGCRPAA